MKAPSWLIGLVGLCVLLATPPGPLETERARLRDTKLALQTERRAGSPRFEDVSRKVGIAGKRRTTYGSVFFDYDRDGDADLLIGHHLRRPDFFENRRDKFRRRFFRAFLPPGNRSYYDRHSCGWGEANRDGRPDLYCVSGAQKGVGTGPNQLLINTGGGFVDRSFKYGLRDLHGRGRSLHWFGYNRDRKLDIFVGNEIRSGHPNRLFRHARRSFKSVGAGLGQQMATNSSAWSDWDRDGDPDLIVTSHGDLGTLAYRNTGAGFARTSLPGITSRVWLSASFGDFNGDGWTDLAMVSTSQLVIFRNRRGRMVPTRSFGLVAGRTATWLDVDNDGNLDLFVVQGRSGGNNKADFLVLRRKGNFVIRRHRSYRGPRGGDGDSVSVADFDRDGRVDVLVTNGYLRSKGRSTLLRNRTPAGHSIELQLNAGKSNPFGFGSRVRIRTKHKKLWREVTDGIGFRGQSEGALHVGLGSATRARIKVLWPRGGKDCVSVRADGLVGIRRGAHRCRG